MSKIHATAIIEKGAKIGKDVEIGPYCVIGKQVVLGDRVKLISHVCVDGDTKIGEDSVVFPFASIGHIPQDLKYHGEKTKLEIGKRNRIREHVTINPGTVTGSVVTKIGDDCLFMVGAHVAHDCVVGNHVILANNATLAGHVEVGDGAILGGLSAVHQFVKIGRGAMIGGMSGVEADVIPYGLVMGERASLHGFNLVGLQRGGVSKALTKEILLGFKDLFDKDGTFEEKKAKVRKEYSKNKLMIEILDFIDAGERHRALCIPKG